MSVFISVLPLFFPADCLWWLRVRKRRRTQRGKCPPPDSDPCSDAELGKNLSSASSQFGASPNCRFQFRKRSQLLVDTHHETLSVTMRVNNPDFSSVAING
jgi:hypothetical protein